MIRKDMAIGLTFQIILLVIIHILEYHMYISCCIISYLHKSYTIYSLYLYRVYINCIDTYYIYHIIYAYVYRVYISYIHVLYIINILYPCIVYNIYRIYMYINQILMYRIYIIKYVFRIYISLIHMYIYRVS